MKAGNTFWAEAFIALLPPDSGGREGSIAPRDGSYRPWARTPSGARIRLRVIEGPPHLGPGEQATVVAEIESGAEEHDLRGAELDLLEWSDVPIGWITVLRVWSGTASAP